MPNSLLLQDVTQSWTWIGSIHGLEGLTVISFFKLVITVAQLMLFFFTNYDLSTLNYPGFTTIKSQHQNSWWHTVYEFDLIPDIYGLNWIG